MNFLAVAYHYVDAEDKYAAGIYPTAPSRLREQIRLIQKHYTIISEEELVSAIRGERALPEKSCLLTFDDALISHYTHAFDIIQEESVPAVFYIPTGHLTGKAYTVHKLHYLLASVPEDELLHAVEKLHREHIGKPVDWQAIGLQRILGWYRYDSESAAKFKYLLNHFLEERHVEKLVHELFASYCDMAEAAFCDTFYLTKEQIKEMSAHPLVDLGLHTHRHVSMRTSSTEQVAEDLQENYRILTDDLGVKSLHGIAYPFGSIDADVFEKKVKDSVETLGLTYGLTTEKQVNTDLSSPFLLHRYGTNDIPGGKKPIYHFE